MKWIWHTNPTTVWHEFQVVKIIQKIQVSHITPIELQATNTENTRQKEMDHTCHAITVKNIMCSQTHLIFHMCIVTPDFVPASSDLRISKNESKAKTKLKYKYNMLITAT
ncbi:unnamed protein product [Vicia faba]|uniref:Uncharacterized protein n=1 Tax=Vicia faba TaxID=3906 RepID=A0AAV0ZQ05_VICFA|nr:unnamed protein product [Vicia faba]